MHDGMRMNGMRRNDDAMKTNACTIKIPEQLLNIYALINSPPEATLLSFWREV